MRLYRFFDGQQRFCAFIDFISVFAFLRPLSIRLFRYMNYATKNRCDGREILFELNGRTAVATGADIQFLFTKGWHSHLRRITDDLRSITFACLDGVHG